MSPTRVRKAPPPISRIPIRVRLKRLAVLVMNLTLYPLSGLAPRSPQRWVFGYTGDVFADNPRYLFLWIRLHRPDIDARWITGSRKTCAMLRKSGYPAHMRWSFGGMVAVLRAGVIVFSHGLGNVNTALSRGAFLLNLWHGVGIKTIHLGHKGGNTVAASRRAHHWIGRLSAIEYLRPYDVVVTTSDAMQDHFARQFRLSAERCPQLGYPRLDCLADPMLAAASEKIDRRQGFHLKPPGFKEILLYVPTYRDTGRPFFEQAIPDAALLSKALAARDALLYIKPHPRTAFTLNSDHDNIRRWPDGIDFNTYLASIDVIITDYSSVLYDYLYYKSDGMILYVFDRDEYEKRDRELVLPYDDNVVGLRVTDFGGLCDAVAAGSALGIDRSSDVKRLRTYFWGGSPSPASPAIVHHVLGKLGAHDVPAVRSSDRVDAA